MFSKKNWDKTFYPFIFFLNELDVCRIDVNSSGDIVNIYKDNEKIIFPLLNQFIVLQCSEGSLDPNNIQKIYHLNITKTGLHRNI